MKKNFGFTLAEVLITLAVIGLVAALAGPALMSSFQSSKVGPSLRKFISTMENANEHILGSMESDTLSFLSPDGTRYMELLTRFVKGSSTAAGQNTINPAITNYDKTSAAGENAALLALPQFNMAGGSDFYVQINENLADSRALAQGSYRGHYATIWYDINGFNVKPNRMGKDIFVFVLDDNGSVLPNGGAALFNAYGGNQQYAWRDGNDKCSDNSVSASALNCSGSIADNNWRVVYKY